MRKNSASQSGVLNPRVLVAFALCKAATASYFREDMTANGFINSADISLLKSKSCTALL
jgi:hypothetical protein